jgi:hypothetical protein
MPSVSKTQQRLMGQAYAVKTGKKDEDEVSDKVAKLAKGMTKKQLKDFASTKHEGLPETKEGFTETSFDNFIKEDYARVHPNPGMNVGGMGPIVIPEVGPYGATGSGDIPAPYSARDSKMMKKGKKKGVMPIKFVETDYKVFENLRGHEGGEEILKQIHEAFSSNDYKLFENESTYTRLLERFLPVNEESDEYYQLSEDEKIELDNLIWESIYQYAISDTIDEGFFDPIIQAAKKAGTKGIELAKKVITNVGSILKEAKEYVITGLVAAVKAGKEAAQKGYSMLKDKADEQFGEIKSKASEEEVKKDVTDLKTTINFILNKIPALEKEGEKDAMSALKNADKEDIEAAQTSLAKAGEKEESNESLFYIGMNNVITELKSSRMADFIQAVMEDVEDSAEEIQDNVEKKKSEGLKSRLTSIVKSHKISIASIIHILVSGVTVFAEAILKALFKLGFKGVSAIVKSFGGPGVYTFTAITTLLAGVTGLFFEFAADIVGEATGTKWLEMVSKALHTTSAVALMSHAAEHAVEHVLPGAMTIIKIGCAAYCIWMLVDHLTHSEEKKPEAEEQPA